MWVCTNQGFISIVQDHKDPKVLKVRARSKAHLEALFPGLPIVETRYTDYQFRVITDRPTVAKLLTSLVMGDVDQPAAVNYGNFKDSVKDKKLHDLYADFWHLHWRYQHDAVWDASRAKKPVETAPQHFINGRPLRARKKATHKGIHGPRGPRNDLDAGGGL
jgi:hypothetical protein